MFCLFIERLTRSSSRFNSCGISRSAFIFTLFVITMCNSFVVPSPKFNMLHANHHLMKNSQQQERVVVCFGSRRENNEWSGDGSNVKSFKMISTTLFEDNQRIFLFSVLMYISGGILGPFLDSYHSLFGVLQYNHPLTLQLWNPNPQYPALVTTVWVPFLFGLAGFIIGWLTIILDEVLPQINDEEGNNETKKNTNPYVICLGISCFVFQYYMSGVLSYYCIPRSIIFIVMSLWGWLGFSYFDGSLSGLLTSLATAVGGPLIEVGLLSGLANNEWGYHYMDKGETGFFPLWIMSVYFLGGPAVGNLARGIWRVLDPLNGENGEKEIYRNRDLLTSREESIGRVVPCSVCNSSRMVSCPNCDGMGCYMAYNRSVTCKCCKGRGLVICRSCFFEYNDLDPSNIEEIREFMKRQPD